VSQRGVVLLSKRTERREQVESWALEISGAIFPFSRGRDITQLRFARKYKTEKKTPNHFTNRFFNIFGVIVSESIYIFKRIHE
jgi:hypothetical protein